MCNSCYFSKIPLTNRVLSLSPRPKPVGVWLVFGRDLRVNLTHRLAVAPSVRFLTDGIVDGVDHAPDLVHVPHEQVVTIFVAVVLDDGFGERKRRKRAPIAGRRGEGREWPVLKHVRVPASDVLDLVLRAVIAEDDVADLRDVL